jgi:hypothetical protein
MKLHFSVIQKLIYVFQNYGGHENDVKLKEQLVNIDLTPYERKTGNQDLILVLTEDYMKLLNNPGGQ